MRNITRNLIGSVKLLSQSNSMLEYSFLVLRHYEKGVMKTRLRFTSWFVSDLGAQLRWSEQLWHFTPLSSTMAGNQSNSKNTTFYGALMDTFKCMNPQEKSTESLLVPKGKSGSKSTGHQLSYYWICFIGFVMPIFQIFVWRTSVQKDYLDWGVYNQVLNISPRQTPPINEWSKIITTNFMHGYPLFLNHDNFRSALRSWDY